ncbi:hypothetical protein COV82_04950 [Candidatus Peregrinibacteria bacterium CG11_big_fil_rev_8_21_14_0_20_46_8]|nr:MAG: hypothetical protein COV82_04950 [Candidatus Peregrinibacteria bacterium CG11_big_fil_rev_8_21_14_0_20_46_8]
MENPSLAKTLEGRLSLLHDAYAEIQSDRGYNEQAAVYFGKNEQNVIAIAQNHGRALQRVLQLLLEISDPYPTDIIDFVSNPEIDPLPDDPNFEVVGVLQDTCLLRELLVRMATLYNPKIALQILSGEFAGLIGDLTDENLSQTQRADLAALRKDYPNAHALFECIAGAESPEEIPVQDKSIAIIKETQRELQAQIAEETRQHEEREMAELREVIGDLFEIAKEPRKAQ